MKITKKDDGSALLECPQGTFLFTDQEFDDLVHAIPINTTALYRLLIDTLVEGDQRKQQLRAIIEATGNASDQLTKIQDEALKHLPGDDD
ncbi:MAG: hypothetical protein KF696_02185 [Planctomycetes bacterium]|nr:hypothetical protein [Planctomycetota bacterium]MCW8134810.1 hypothetical protein [Planctomycetota bacterium]